MPTENKYWTASSTSNTSFTSTSNWSTGAAPANGDTLFFNGFSSVNCATDIATTGLTGITLIVEKSYLGRIGSLSATGTAVYLGLDGGTVYLERLPAQGTAVGSDFIAVNNTGTNSMSVTVFDSNSTSVSTNVPPILLKGGALTVYASGGTVGIAALPGESSTVTLRVNEASGATVQPYILLGEGVTPTAITSNTGTVHSRSNNTCTAATLGNNAIYNYEGTGAHTALNVNDSSTCYYSGTGTCTTATCRGGTLDLSRDARAKTLTDTILYKNSTLNVDNGVPGGVVFTNPIQHPDGIDEVTIKTPAGVKGTLIAI